MSKGVESSQGTRQFEPDGLRGSPLHARCGAHPGRTLERLAAVLGGRATSAG